MHVCKCTMLRSACISVRMFVDYIVRMRICCIARINVYMTRHIAGYDVPRSTRLDRCTIADPQPLTATISHTSLFMFMVLHRIHVHVTIFSKFFSQLPQGTCFLPVSGIYQCFDELYHPFVF